MLFSIVTLFPLSLTHSFHFLYPVHFFQGEECEGGEMQCV